MEDSLVLKKNLLDLKFQYYLTIHSVSIISILTLVIGTFIALISEQIQLQNFYHMLFISIISVPFYLSGIIAFFYTKNRLNEIYRILQGYHNKKIGRQ